MARRAITATAAEGPTADGSTVSVVDKVFDLLDVLAEGEDVTASELADRIGQPRSSVYRLLAKLRRRGWVEPGSDHATFRLGLEVLRFAEVVRSRFDVRQVARPTMEQVHREVGGTVYLCVRSQDKSLCIERIDGSFVGQAFLDVGGALPLHVGATSQVLLAFEPESEWQRYVEANELARFTPKTESSPKELFAKLKEVRDDGYAISDEDVTPGLGACGTPIFDRDGKVVAAISVGGLRQTVLGPDLPTIVDLMKEAGHQISRALGSDIRTQADRRGGSASC